VSTSFFSSRTPALVQSLSGLVHAVSASVGSHVHVDQYCSFRRSCFSGVFPSPGSYTLSASSSTGFLEPWGEGFYRDMQFSSKNCSYLKKTQGQRMKQRLKESPHLRIHPICRHQTQTLLLMPRSTCWEEPGMAVTWEGLPELDQYRCSCSQPTIRLSLETPMEELGEGLKELKGFATPKEEH